MAFLGLMTVREHRAVVKHKDTLFELRGEVVAERDATIFRLQRENARLLDKSTRFERLFKLADDRDSDGLVALSEIAANVTPGANATVKRMARIAQDAIDARRAAINKAAEWLDCAPKVQAARGEVV